MPKHYGLWFYTPSEYECCTYYLPKILIFVTLGAMTFKFWFFTPSENDFALAKFYNFWPAKWGWMETESTSCIFLKKYWISFGCLLKQSVDLPLSSYLGSISHNKSLHPPPLVIWAQFLQSVSRSIPHYLFRICHSTPLDSSFTSYVGSVSHNQSLDSSLPGYLGSVTVSL